MRSRNTLLVGIGLLCLALLLVAFFSSRERAGLRAELAATLERQAALRSDLHKAVAQTAASSRTDPSTAVPASEPAPAATPAALPPPAHKKVPSLIDLARDNPGLWNEWVISKKAEFAQLYGPLFQTLGLTPAQREKFKEIKAAEIARSSDIAAAMDTQQLPWEDPAIAALRSQSQKQLQVELAALLGEPAYAELKDYDRTLMVRGLADGLAVQVAASDPLSAQQADRLTRALANASLTYRKGEFATSKDVDWASVDEQAKTILTPAQFAIWQQGTAHNPYGGSRRDVELQKIYDQTVKAGNSGGN